MEFSNSGAADNATLDNTASSTQTYSAGNTNYSLTNGHALLTSESGITLSNKLVHSSVENAGRGKVTLSNSGNTLTGVSATGGDIEVLALSQVELAQLVIAAEMTITAAEVTVTELAKLADSAKLAGDLTLEGALPLQTGLTLSGIMLDRITGLQAGEYVELFRGVTELNVEQTLTLHEMSSLAEQTAESLTDEELMDVD